MKEVEIVIIGAGAAGLMAARELSQAGKKVIILEGRERIGGRIWSLEKNDFGYAAEAGAEFIHGNLPVTKSLIKEAGLTILPSEGELWSAREGELTKSDNFIPDWGLLLEKLKEVKEDLPINQFLEQKFPKDKYTRLHNSIIGFIEGYDAADPKQASTLALRNEWISENKIKQFRIKEGYGALMTFLYTECLKQEVSIFFNTEVKSIRLDKEKVSVQCTNGKIYEAAKAILTIPLPLFKRINFIPAIPEKIKSTSEIGFGTVIKFLFKFKDRWWARLAGKDLSKAGFVFSNEIVPTWWMQYPEKHSVLTGWIAGPNAEKFSTSSFGTLTEMGILSLSKIFKIEKELLKKELLYTTVINWGLDPFALGAYAYATPKTPEAKAQLNQPVNDKLFFSGEGLYEGKEMGTVEAALSSGFKTATNILKSF